MTRGRAGRAAGWQAVLVVAAVLLAWELAARAGWIRELFFPAPDRFLAALYRMAASGSLGAALAATLGRLGIGVLAGAALGATVGWLMGGVRSLRVVLDPLVATLHPLPKLALFPLFLVVLGIGESAKIAIIALAAFFPMALTVTAGVLQIGRLYMEVAASYGASPLLKLRRVLLPGSVPMLLTGFRLALNGGLVVTIAVEMLSSEKGLGSTVWFAWQTMRMADLYAVLVVVAILGLAFNGLLGFLARRLAPWTDGEPG